ncbi:MAG: CpcT/CpeT family chromophore lyase [Steroidobacteraceae bacterium]
MAERAFALCTLLFLAACSSTADLRKAELAELAGWLPGTYGEGEASLAFVPIYAPFISDNVFLMEESQLQDGRRAAAQRVVAFEVIDKHIVQASYLLADPARWRAGLLHPDLFKSLMESDLKLLAGCEMLWVRDKDKDKFVGANDRKNCRSSRPGGSLAFLDSRAEVSADDYARNDRYFDAAGRQLSGPPDDALERFRRR